MRDIQTYKKSTYWVIYSDISFSELIIIYVYVYFTNWQIIYDVNKKEIYKEKRSYKGGMHIDYVQT